MAHDERSRLPLAHVIAHDGSRAADRAYESSNVLNEEVVVVLPGAARGAGESERSDAVGALTIDRVLRTARAGDAPYATIPVSLLPADRALLPVLDAVTRLATPQWPAVVVQVVREEETQGTEVVVVATHGQTSGSTLLAATLVAVLSGSTLTAVVSGGDGDERVQAGVRSPDADLGMALRERYGVPTRYVRLERDADAERVHTVLAGLDPRWVVVGLGQVAPGLSYRDLTREGRRRLLGGPLRVEHLALRSMCCDSLIVADSARLRRRAALGGRSGLGEYLTGDLDRLDAVVAGARRRWAEGGSAEVGDVDRDPRLLGTGEQGAVEPIERGPRTVLPPFNAS